MKVVQLHVHKNTLARRKRKEMRAALLKEIKEHFDEHEITAFALVMISKAEDVYSLSNPGSLRASEFTLLVKDGMQEATMGYMVEAAGTEENSDA